MNNKFLEEKYLKETGVTIIFFLSKNITKIIHESCQYSNWLQAGRPGVPLLQCKVFPLLCYFRVGSGSHATDAGRSFPSNKRVGEWMWILIQPMCNVELKNSWSCASTLPSVFTAWCLLITILPNKRWWYYNMKLYYKKAVAKLLRRDITNVPKALLSNNNYVKRFSKNDLNFRRTNNIDIHKI
jgi:hypothetical protein